MRSSVRKIYQVLLLWLCNTIHCPPKPISGFASFRFSSQDSYLTTLLSPQSSFIFFHLQHTTHNLKRPIHLRKITSFHSSTTLRQHSKCLSNGPPRMTRWYVQSTKLPSNYSVCSSLTRTAPIQLLLKILETSNISLDVKKISEAWGKSSLTAFPHPRYTPEN